MPMKISHTRRQKAKSLRDEAVRVSHGLYDGLQGIVINSVEPATSPHAGYLAFRRGLAALPEDPDPDAVYDLQLKHNPWPDGTPRRDPTLEECGSCNEPSPIIVEIGNEPDYDSSTAYVCETCLRDALALIEAEKSRG